MTDVVEHQVFISHSSSDEALAVAICSFLEQNGVSAWISSRDIRPGEDYATAIIRGIEGARCVLLLLSGRANRSNAVRSEIERAFHKSKAIVPFRVEPVTLSRSLEFFLSTSQWLDGSTDPASHFPDLLRAVSARVTVPPSIPPPRPPAKAETQHLLAREVPLDEFTRREHPKFMKWFLALFDNQ